MASMLRVSGHQSLAVAVLLGAALLVGVPLAAQTTAAETPGQTPRKAMLGYLDACRAGDYKDAAKYLDLQNVPPAARAARGPTLARELKTVLDRTLWVDLDKLSDAPEGDRQDGLPPQRDLVGTIEAAKGPVPIYLDRVQHEGGPTWQIAAATVAHAPSLYREFGYGPLGDLLPPMFFEIRFLEVQLWQWLGLVILIAVAVVVSWSATGLILRSSRVLIQRTRSTLAPHLLDLGVGPIRLILAILVFTAGMYSLALAVPVQDFFAALQKALLILAVTWLLARIVEVAAQAVQQRWVLRGEQLAASAVPLGRRTVKVLVWFLAGLAVMQNFGINVTSILAGLGIGGIAVALAAQKTVENLFGGVTLIMDHPVRVGDFCRFGDKIGTVEDVGLRSTRVRTLDRTVVTIPNGQFAGMALENFTKRDRIWFHTTLGLRYETRPDQLRYILIELKKLLVAHPKVDPAPARIRFVGFGAYSLDLEIFAYILTSDYDEFLAIQEDLLLRIMEIVDTTGSGFAFPSQTIYAGADSGLDDEKTRTAMKQLQGWRDANELGLPSMRPEQLQALQHTLDYPPKGSVLRAQAG
jgi:MscS family membrane protein